MTETVSKIFASTENHLRQLNERIKDYDRDEDGEIKSIENFSIDDFSLNLENAVQDISRATTQIALAYIKPPFPDAKESGELMNSIESASDCLVVVYCSLPKELGQYFHHDIFKIVRDILKSVLDFIQAIDGKGFKGSRERLKAAGYVFSACEEVQKMPENNLKSILNILHNEELVLFAALQEINEEVRSDFSAQKSEEEIDNTEMWNNQDRELLPSCIALVKTARSAVKKVMSAIKSNGDCKSLVNISELDSVALTVEDLSPAVDTFVVAIYPPMNQKTVKTVARDVVNIIQKLLKQVQKSHFVRDDDHKWLSYHLKAVDHNNNKLQPLLSQETMSDSEEAGD